MTGSPTLSVKLDDGTGTYPFDITTYVELQFGLTITRGRGTEFDQVQPGTCTLTLNNTDGRFTIGSAVYPVFYDQRIRVAETVGGTTYTRFTGYVQDFPVSWPDGGDTYAVATITAVDRQTRLNRRKLKAITLHELLADSPFALYTLGEESGAVTAGDTSGNNRPNLIVAGTGVAPEFGSAALNLWDASTGCTFAAGECLLLDPWPVLPAPLPPTTGAVTVECVVERAGAPATFNETLWTWVGISALLRLDTAGTVTGLLGGAFPVTSTTNVCDGAAHHCAVTISTSAGLTTIELFVDGASQGTASITFVSVSGVALTVGQGVNGTLWYLAIYSSALPSARIAVHANGIRNGFGTERADQRIARLAGYANIPVGEQNLETGQQPSIAAQTTAGVDVQSAMQAVADAELGTVFIAGDGKLTEQNKSHRPLKATGSPAVTLTADQIDPNVAPGGARNYLVNTADGSRNGGASQRSVNAASVLLYEEYPKDSSNALLPTDDLMLNQLTWLTAMYSSPLPRLPSLPLDLMTLPQATVQQILAAEFGDMVRITGWPAQTPTSLGDLLVEGWTETLTHQSWDIALNTVPAQLFRPWILGDATQSVLGVTTRPYP